jgi:uncharacterized small protein (DUF1192 family)
MKRLALLLPLAFASPAWAQDIRGLELCTAEKTMERRTGCLQANVEFLQQALAKQTRAFDDKIAAANAEIAALKAQLVKLEADLVLLKPKPPEPAKK